MARKSVSTAAPTGGDPQPYLALKQCVVTQGIYPSRN